MQVTPAARPHAGRLDYGVLDSGVQDYRVQNLPTPLHSLFRQNQELSGIQTLLFSESDVYLSSRSRTLNLSELHAAET